MVVYIKACLNVGPWGFITLCTTRKGSVHVGLSVLLYKKVLNNNYYF